MKATEQYFPVVLFIMLYKVVLTFESVDECDHSNNSNCLWMKYLRTIKASENIFPMIMVASGRTFIRKDF